MSEELFALSYEGEPCSLLVIPQSNSQLVISAAEKLEQDLPIDILGEQFSSLAIFIRLASCAVKGNVQLEIEVRRIMRDVVSLCDETIHTLNDFKWASNVSLETMQSAYGYLKDGLEDRSLMMLKRLKVTSEKMEDASSSLSKRCKEESEEIEKVQEMAMKEKDTVEQAIKSQEAIISKSKEKKERNKELINEASKSVAETKERLKEKEKMQEENHKLMITMITDQEKRLKEINESLEKQIKNLRSSHAESKKFLDNSLISLMNKKQSELDKKIELNQQIYNEAIKANEQTFDCALKHNKLDLEKKQQDNQKQYESKVSEIDKKYKECIEKNEEFKEKCISIEKIYTDAEKNSTQSYREALQRNTENLKTSLKQAQDNYENLLVQNENDLKTKLQQSETNFTTEALRSIEGNPDLAIPIEITEDHIKTRISSIEQHYQEQLKQNTTRFDTQKAEIEGECATNKRQAATEKKSQLNSISESQKDDEQSYNEKFDSVKMPEKEGVLSSLNPIGKDQRKKEYEAKLEAAQNKKQDISAAYQTREKSRAQSKNLAESGYQSSVIEYERQKSQQLSQLNDHKLSWDSQARQERDDAIANVYRDKQNRDAEITTIKSKRLAVNAQLKAKQENSLSSMRELKSESDAKASQKKSQLGTQAREERLKLDRDAALTKDESIDKADKRRREDIRNAEKEKSNCNKMAAIERDDKLKDASKSLKAENEKAEREKTSADNIAKTTKQNADKRALDEKHTKNEQDERMTNCKLKQLNEKHEKQKDEEEAQLLKSIEDITASHEKEKTEIDKTTADKLNLQKEKQVKLQSDEEKQETKVEQLKRKKEEHEKKMAEAALRMQEAVKQKHNKTSAKECLDEAISALRNVGDTMQEAANFWREMNALCSYVADEKLMAQVERIDSSDKEMHQKIWTSQTFKSDALQFYLKWAALKGICEKACTSVGYAKTDAHKYVRENPGEKESLMLVEKLGNIIQQKALTYSENTTVSSCEGITDGIKAEDDVDTSIAAKDSTKSNDDMQETLWQSTLTASSSIDEAKQFTSEVPVSNDSSDSCSDNCSDSCGNNCSDDTDTDENKD